MLMGATILLFGAALGRGAPLNPAQRVIEIKIEPFDHYEYWRKFDAGKRALAIVVGSNRSNMGLYVFDAHGNCVARDDNMSLLSRDDLVAEWFPAQTGPFSLQVKSLARVPNKLWLVVRQEERGGGQ
jgi:hypothetical protein